METRAPVESRGRNASATTERIGGVRSGGRRLVGGRRRERRGGVLRRGLGAEGSWIDFFSSLVMIPKIHRDLIKDREFPNRI